MCSDLLLNVQQQYLQLWYVSLWLKRLWRFFPFLVTGITRVQLPYLLDLVSHYHWQNLMFQFPQVNYFYYHQFPFFLLCFPNNYLAPLFVYSFSIKVMLRIYCEHFCYASSWWCNLWTYIHNIYILRFLLYFNLVLVDILPWAYLWFVWL